MPILLILDHYIILLKLKFTIKPVLFPSCSTYTYNTDSSYLTEVWIFLLF